MTINDKALQEAIETYDTANQNYKAILYVCLVRGAGNIMATASARMRLENTWGNSNNAIYARVNDFSIVAVHHDALYLYVLDKFKRKLIIIDKLVLPYEAILKLKISKFLVWTTLKIRFTKKRRVKVRISNKVAGLKNQKENIQTLLDYLNRNSCN